MFKLQEISLLKSEAGQKRFRLVMCANKGTGVGGVGGGADCFCWRLWECGLELVVQSIMCRKAKLLEALGFGKILLLVEFLVFWRPRGQAPIKILRLAFEEATCKGTH